MMNLNLKQPLVLPAHHSNVVGSRLSSSSPSAAAASRRTGGGVSSRSGSRRHVRLPRISCSATEEVSGAVSSVTVERMLTVTASVEASPAIGQMYFQRAVDDIGDLLGKTLLLELVSSELDAKSGVEKTRVTAYAHKTLREGHYEAEFKVPASFGPVGAVLVENEHHKEVFIKEIKLVTGGDSSTAVTFDCNSWVHSKFDNPEKRIFFTLKSYLPSDTPKGLEDLRKKDLQALRGDGHGERKVFERVYDYDVYNDLGDPDKNPAHQRPVLGGNKQYPYPRRCRTGRPRTKKDPETEMREGHNYVPRDEQFSEVKQLTFGATTLRSGLHALLPALRPLLINKKDLRFPHFPAIDDLFSDGIPLPAQTGFDAIRTVVPRMVKLVEDTTDHVLRFEVPEMIERDRFSWFKDEEFARQTIAGLNPLCIQLLTEFPIKSKLDPEVYGPAESAITKEILEKQMNGALTVEQALAAKRLFILDYHDVFLPYVHKVRELQDATLYASRTIFFLTDLGTLMPLAIELTRPKSPTRPQWKRAFTHGPDATDAWLWKLAKAHVLTHDTGYHQLVSHWLRTHCCVEPYIIAANRQLSRLHPVYRLLHPHFRYTMEINALAREALINADGIIEESFWPGKYAVELSSVAYGATWQFDTEALPNDLIKRGLAVRGEDGELELTIKDYPYAHDGLLVWDSIRQWASEYVNVYYKSDEAVAADPELRAFWDEVRNVGHGDKKDEPWWPVLDTRDSLVETLTTIMWVTSGHHSAVNFGQYHFAGYFPNRPTTIRKNMPVEEGGPGEEMEKFLKQPETTLLDMLPTQMQAIKVMTTLDILSSHSPDEEYMGEFAEPSWLAEPMVKAAFEKFGGRMKEIEGFIDECNNNLDLKNRCGAGIVPYELLKPFSKPGVTGRGIPSSISI
ncbi:linoleate 13S-lipoxygenase10 [Zea mays]|uniref:Lipoxygenase n=4 Tax=Zea mays TaxID=4577 RepID=Q06XS3_MAIZE|nr:linoleate 13S-lipoxygenase10 [Zea mays]ABF01001.1 lipoxygenase [Zea mays]AQK60089.1 lipoxygenase10 [Zea mays]AQK60092.1 lipoxygenase10 [Zea mays]|eukprot:NP_001105980.2 linoleate 13S-lipoxygenase10 [Zea mays]